MIILYFFFPPPSRCSSFLRLPSPYTATTVSPVAGYRTPRCFFARAIRGVVIRFSYDVYPYSALCSTASTCTFFTHILYCVGIMQKIHIVVVYHVLCLVCIKSVACVITRGNFVAVVTLRLQRGSNFRTAAEGEKE